MTQEFEPLRPQRPGEKANARHVATRPVEAGDEAIPDRVASGDEDDRNSRGRSLGRKGRDTVRNDHGHRPANQIGRESPQPVRLIVR